MRLVKIEDRRQETMWINAKEILETIIPTLSAKNLVGIRKIVLLDNDYHRGEKGLGRYLLHSGGTSADIEMYFDYYSSLPVEAQNSSIYLTYLISETLLHEIYHHIIRGQKRLKRPSLKDEEKNAHKWAQGGVNHIMKKLGILEEYEAEMAKFGKMWNRAS
jgi:hypothetical protein